MTRVLIADDERLARLGLRRLVERQPGAVVAAECTGGREAVRAIRELRPDLVLLDVQMPELDGFGVIAEVGPERMPATVFVTAHDEYALRAFEAHAVDYLLKPIDDERFQDAFDRAVEQRWATDARALGSMMNELARLASRGLANAAASSGEPSVRPGRLAVRDGNRVVFVEPEEIDWIEAAGNNVRLHVGRAVFDLRSTLDQVEARLRPEAFVRIRRSALVRARAIRSCEHVVKSSYLLTLQDGTRLTSSRHYVAAIRALLG